VEAGTSVSREDGTGYTGASVAGAVLGTLSFPLISLIAALLLLGAQTDPRKRSALRTWAWASAGWIALQGIVLVALFAWVLHSSGSESSGPCVGGPKLNVVGKAVPGSTTKFVIPCEISGTQTITTAR
jgi:hypothetical protein